MWIELLAFVVIEAHLKIVLTFAILLQCNASVNDAWMYPFPKVSEKKNTEKITEKNTETQNAETPRFVVNPFAK